MQKSGILQAATRLRLNFARVKAVDNPGYLFE